MWGKQALTGRHSENYFYGNQLHNCVMLAASEKARKTDTHGAALKGLFLG
jgi:hypothetical protein